MNINLNTVHQASVPQIPDGIAPSKQNPSKGNVAALSITYAAADSDEIAGAEVSAKELVRNDSLGQFVSMVFNLPPPPFPVLSDS